MASSSSVYPTPPASFSASTAADYHDELPVTASAIPANIYDLPTTTPPEEEIPLHEQEKQGGVCFGFCCDMRKATIVVNCMAIGINTFMLVTLFNQDSTVETLRQYGQLDIDDDQVLEDFASVQDTIVLANAIIGGLTALLTVIPLYGAFAFRASFLMFGVVLILVSFVARFVVAYLLLEEANEVLEPTGKYEVHQPWVLHTLSVLVMVLMLYPHIGYIMEIRAGIMSAETYAREDYSCGCRRRG